MVALNSDLKTVTASGNPVNRPEIDGLLYNKAWAVTELEYSFPTQSDFNVYLSTPSGFTNSDLHAFSQAQKETVFYALDADQGSVASGAFSVEGITNLEFTLDPTPDVGAFGDPSILDAEELLFAGDLRSGSSLGYAFAPTSTNSAAGNVFLRTKPNGEFVENVANGSQPEQLIPGGRANYTVMHEAGHALGLKHPNNNDLFRGFGTLSPELDDLTYTIMVDKTTVGPSINPALPQTFMIGDIAALQYLYGANYTTNAGNTVYTWQPNSPNTVINGQTAIDATGAPSWINIFASIWDGGGEDTYDTSAYTSNQSVDLRPGESSVFDASDLVAYDGSKKADGQIYNSFLFNGNTASLIENSTTGSGNDEIIGNQGANKLTAKGGDDRMDGGAGNDTLDGGAGTDTIRLEVMRNTSTVNLTDNGSGQWSVTADGLGTDSLIDVERVQFDDGTYQINMVEPAQKIEFLYLLYDTVFDRKPDEEGYDFWLNQHAANNLTQGQLLDAFAASTEYAGIFGGLNDTQFITTLYNQALDRGPDAAGLQHYQTLLANGATRNFVTNEISASSEHQGIMSDNYGSNWVWVETANALEWI